MTRLELAGVAKEYGSFRLGPLELSVGDEVLAVLGPSGCGKTTLLSIVAGFVRPDTGRIRLDGRELTRLQPQERGTVMVFQDGALFPHLTARENVAYAGASPARVDELAARLEIEDVLEQRAPTLSGGQRQRVALARSLAAEPEVLLLDEPLSSLDAPIKRRLRDELRSLLASLGIPVVYVTHDQKEATVVGDRVAVLADGQLHQVGDPTAVFERPETPFVAAFTGAVNRCVATIVATDKDAVTLDWGPHRVSAPPVGATAGERVTFTVRPERLEVVPTGTAPPDPADNVIPARVVSRQFEGDAYSVTFRPAGVETDVVGTFLPPAYDRAGLSTRDEVQLTFPAGAVHLLDTDDPPSTESF